MLAMFVSAKPPIFFMLRMYLSVSYILYLMLWQSLLGLDTKTTW